MKTSLLSLALAVLIAMPVAGRAQATYISTDTSGTQTALGLSTAIQTFSGFSNISSISWNVDNSGAPASFNAYVAQWNSGSSEIIGSLTQFGSAQFTSGLGDVLTFNASMPTLDPSLTYALILTSTDASASGVTANTGTIPGGANGSFFGSGAGAGYTLATFNNNGGASGLEAFLQSNPATMSTESAYQMSVTGTLAPVPEPKTAAAGFAALFVAALIGRRTWQRRKLATVPVTA